MASFVKPICATFNVDLKNARPAEPLNFELILAAACVIISIFSTLKFCPLNGCNNYIKLHEMLSRNFFFEYFEYQNALNGDLKFKSN